MLTLNLNHNKMGMRPRGETWEWHTAIVPQLAIIHVHNRNVDNEWVWVINSGYIIKNSVSYPNKDAAFESAQRTLWDIMHKAFEQIDLG